MFMVLWIAYIFQEGGKSAPLTQCAAVNTYLFDITTPPQ